jgi:AcrR family transcriptional regulator
MVEPVKKRAYSSPRREQQAAETRTAILDAAQGLFERDGFSGTTMDAIANEAAVSLKTVYLAFDTKGRLLRAVWDRALKGDESDAPVAVRPWYVEVLEESDPERKLRLLAANACVVKQRIGALLRVIRDAAPSDPAGRELWELIQSDFYANQRTIVDSLDRSHHLAPHLDARRAADLLWTLNHPDLWLLLVGQRGWKPAEFETWLGDTACAQLLSVNSARQTKPRAAARKR